MQTLVQAFCWDDGGGVGVGGAGPGKGNTGNDNFLLGTPAS